jgi:hypothetical protein
MLCWQHDDTCTGYRSNIAGWENTCLSRRGNQKAQACADAKRPCALTIRNRTETRDVSSRLVLRVPLELNGLDVDFDS